MVEIHRREPLTEEQAKANAGEVLELLDRNLRVPTRHDINRTELAILSLVPNTFPESEHEFMMQEDRELSKIPRHVELGQWVTDLSILDGSSMRGADAEMQADAIEEVYREAA